MNINTLRCNTWTWSGQGIFRVAQEKEYLDLARTNKVYNTLINTWTWSGQAILEPYLGHGTVEHLDIVKTRRTSTLQGQVILGHGQDNNNYKLTS